LDPVSIELFKGDAYCMEFAETKSKLWLETQKLESFLGRAEEFSGIFYVGGFGRKIPMISVGWEDLTNIRLSVAMFDLVNDPISIKLIREFHDASRIVTALCHGSAALLNVTLADGSHLIKGERITGFSNDEEIAVDRVKDMPFHLEDYLNEASSGHYEKAANAWDPHVTVSSTKKLFSGQNPASAKPLAIELLKALNA
jgi:hypothetical protein